MDMAEEVEMLNRKDKEVVKRRMVDIAGWSSAME